MINDQRIFFFLVSFGKIDKISFNDENDDDDPIT